jgi:hypothetical protein
MRVPAQAHAADEPGTRSGRGCEDDPIPPSTTAYRSAARRLRGRFANDPARLQRALRDLARREDANRAASALRGRHPEPAVQPLQDIVDGEAAARFAFLVRQHLTGPVLCYEDRESLLRTAARLGIGRFDANLIIAAVQHRAEGEHVDVRGTATEQTGATGRWWASVAIVLAVETSLSLVAWWALRG